MIHCRGLIIIDTITFPIIIISNRSDSITRRFLLENSLNEKYQEQLSHEQNHDGFDSCYRIEITRFIILTMDLYINKIEISDVPMDLNKTFNVRIQKDNCKHLLSISKLSFRVCLIWPAIKYKLRNS